MPQTYSIKDPTSGKTVKLTGDSPPTEAELTEIFAKLNSNAEEPPSASGGGMLDTALEFGKGVLKSPLAIIETGGNLIRKIPGVQALEDATGAYLNTGIDTKPQNPAQSVGRVVGDIGTAFVPGGAVTRGARAAASATPYVGPLVRGAVEALGAGGIAAAQGHDPTIPALVGGGLGTVAGSVRALRGAMVNPNPIERAALEYVHGQGVPVDAGTMSGNSMLKGTKFLADKTFGGAAVAQRAGRQEGKALESIGESLAERASPGAGSQTPETAGRGLYGAVEKTLTDLHDAANQGYDDLRALEPSNLQDIVVGYKPSPSGLVKNATPIIEKMAFPVNLKSVKSALKPVYDRMMRQMPVTQQQASPGLKAIQNIMEGPDVAPASIVDLDLSAIKSIARQADRPELRDIGQGLAAGAVKELDDAVKAAIGKGGPKALAALNAGRQATVKKYLAADVLDRLRTEPVGTFRQVTQAKDAAIDQLIELQKLAPAEMPNVARAYVEELVNTATRNGRYEGADSIAKQWQNLGTRTKSILFKNPTLVNELDKFFLAAKRLAENQNPSNSGGIVSIGSQLGAILVNPALGLGAQGLGPVVSAAMRNPRVVRIMTQGISGKPISAADQAFWASIAPLTAQEKR